MSKIDFRARMMAQLDRNSQLHEASEKAHEKGLAEGRSKGRFESLAEVAQKMKSMGLTAEQILTITGIQPD